MVGVVIKIYAVLKTNINYIWYPLFTASVLWKAIYTCTEFTAVNRNIVINWKLNIINKTCFYIIFVKNIGRIRTPYVYTWSYNSVLFSIYNFLIYFKSNLLHQIYTICNSFDDRLRYQTKWLIAQKAYKIGIFAIRKHLFYLFSKNSASNSSLK